MSWTDAEAAFAEHFDRYEPRLSQRHLAEHIEGALAECQPFMAEAPTGTGKSFAAMVPAIDFAVRSGRPVCAATGTKALQDQYIRDMEMLKRVYKSDLRYVVVKGRGNYACKAKLAEIEKGTESGPQGIDMGKLKDAAEEVDGDLDQLGFALSVGDKMSLSATSDECPGKSSCPFGSVCFAERVKNKAATSHVVIANHALVAVDAVLKAQGVPMLPEFSAMVIDEGHEFENYVSGALSVSISERSLTDLATRVVEFTGDRESLGRANVTSKMLFDKLRILLRNAQQENRRQSTVAITPALLLQLGEELSSALRMLGHFEATLAMREAHTDDEVLKRKRLRKRVETMSSKIKAVVMADFADSVRWIEVEAKTRRDGSTTERLTLEQSPLDVAPFLSEFFWPDRPSVIVSATLSVAGDFSYLAKRLGLPEGYGSFQCPSPFDYATQSVTYAPIDMPDPRKEADAYRAAVNLHITELVRAADGRALLLFTSWDALRSAHRALKPVIESMGHKVLMQGEAPTKVLADTFRDDEHSVLFAVKSFFTGVDIQGDSLRLLVVDKLPFPVPSVLFNAQCDAINAAAGNKWASFSARQVPEMKITLTQACGRLIRSTSDRGLMAILDPRLHTANYGPKTLAGLRRTFPTPLVTDLREATAYLESLEDADREHRGALLEQS